MNFENYTFESILAEALARVPETVDKRQGSIIYDALAPACYQLAEFYLNLYQLSLEINLETAADEYLDRKVADYGLTRIAATQAIKKAYFENDQNEAMSIPLMSRFSTISETESLIYEVINQHVDEHSTPVPGTYDLRCTTAGTNGNDYTGNLIAISFINNLATAVMQDVYIAGRDEETDDELRTRCKEAITKKEFAGNVTAYKTALKEMEGVGYAQVYPTWNGGGTVKVSVLDYDFNPIENESLARIQQLVDPESYSGDGLGIAPIGHRVTIVSGTKKLLNIHTEVQLAVGYQIAQLQDTIEQSIEEYLQTVRLKWDTADDLNQYSLAVYISQINRAILSVPGIDNVRNTTLNDQAEDLILTESAVLQEIPFLGEVTYAES